MRLASDLRHLRLVGATLASAAMMCAAAGAEQDWRQVSDFVAQGVFASGETVVAWNALQYSVSTDGGIAWSNPIGVAVQGQNPEMLRAAAVSNTGVVVQTATGKVLSGAITGAVPLPVPAATGMAVDGHGLLYLEGVDGAITVAGTPVAGAKGRIYRAVADGVLVQSGRSSLTLVRPAGVSEVKFQGETLPPVMDLAPLTTPGGDRWATTKGTTWLFKGGKVTAFGEREAGVKSYGFGPDGYHELLAFQGLQITFLQGETGLAGHWRTKHLPQDAVLLTVTAKHFVAATPRGIWNVPIERR